MRPQVEVQEAGDIIWETLDDQFISLSESAGVRYPPI
jgi:hypothetical protein